MPSRATFMRCFPSAAAAAAAQFSSTLHWAVSNRHVGRRNPKINYQISRAERMMSRKLATGYSQPSSPESKIQARKEVGSRSPMYNGMRHPTSPQNSTVPHVAPKVYIGIYKLKLNNRKSQEEETTATTAAVGRQRRIRTTMMMNDSRAHLSWCAELSRSTDAHQARLGDGITTGPQTPTPGRIRSILRLRAKRAKSPVRKSNMGRLPRPTHNNRTLLPRQKQGRAQQLGPFVDVSV